MDEKTKILVSIGAAVGANCVPCFEHYFEKMEAVGLTREMVQEAADIADQVKNGARMTMSKRVRGLVGTVAPSGDCGSDKACCS
jgi:alkylhydroperoxidase/carboxymuconolactone decarboxylase family protein YurZ